jgi:hypothetical protein
MYNSLRRVIGELVGLRRLTIRMHVGHLVTFDGYRAIRDCVVDEQRRIDNFDQLVAHSNTSIFALLPTLISLEIACTYADGAGRGSGRGGSAGRAVRV